LTSEFEELMISRLWHAKWGCNDPVTGRKYLAEIRALLRSRPSKELSRAFDPAERNSIMRAMGSLLSFKIAFVLCLGFNGAVVLAAATPAFTISAANTTVSASGTGTTTFTLTASNGYSGTIVVNCEAASPPADAKLPYCGGSAVLAEKLNSGETVSGSVPLTKSRVPGLANLQRRPGTGSPAGLALAGALMLLLIPRRSARRSLAMVVFAVCALLAGSAEISACGGNGNGLTSGTFPYTITGTDITTSATASSTFMVTVP
jgi:hypothetical protein